MTSFKVLGSLLIMLYLGMTSAARILFGIASGHGGSAAGGGGGGCGVGNGGGSSYGNGGGYGRMVVVDKAVYMVLQQ